MFSLIFVVGKMKFHHCNPLENPFGLPLEKSSIASLWKKSFRRPWLQLTYCRAWKQQRVQRILMWEECVKVILISFFLVNVTHVINANIIHTVLPLVRHSFSVVVLCRPLTKPHHKITEVTEPWLFVGNSKAIGDIQNSFYYKKTHKYQFYTRPHFGNSFSW